MSRGNFTACPGRWEPSGRLLFPAPDDWGTRTAAGGFASNGREVFACNQAESCALRSAGIRRAPRRGKRVDTKVSTLLTPTSFYFVVRRRPENGDRFEKEERQRIFPLIRTDLLRVRPFLLPIRSSVTLLLHISATLRRRYV